MESYTYLLFLAIILFATKLFGLFSRKVQMPAVVGALVAGLVLGPSLFNVLTLSGEAGQYLKITAEIGVIFLMFSAGLETDLKELNENKVASLVTAVIGVLLPLIGGFVTYVLMFGTDLSNFSDLLTAFFIGVVLTATSVSITVETLRELGKLKGRVGTVILGAAIIDDILGIIILSVITSLTDTSVHVGIVLIKIGVYFVVLLAIGALLRYFKNRIEKVGIKRRVPIFAISFCFLMAYMSEHFFGVADITGAYFAGLMLSYMDVSEYIKKRIETPSYLFFSPVFFASVGMQTSISGMGAKMWAFTLVLLIVAILTKVVGCGLGAKMCGMKNKESLQIGIGMISRGEVALIVAQKGYSVGLLDQKLFAPIVLVVIVTTLITPILLKIFMADKKVTDLELKSV
jgi:Kef-type K+ transport system membrane component KefB